MKNVLTFFATFVLLFVFWLFISPTQASAHCDTLDGPVINAARKALGSGNVNYILIWVKPEDENEIKKALKRARNKRKKAKTKKDKDAADMELFETLVKIHREGEGAKYEGVKPAESLEPEIALADRAVETGSLDEVLKHISSQENKEIVKHLFHKVQEKSKYEIDDLVSGREFIDAYVFFIHTVEKVIKGLPLHGDHKHH